MKLLWSDNMDFDKEKFKNVLHYLISKCEKNNTFGRTVLYKLAYFSDFNYFEIYEKSLTNESYKKLPHGPAPIHFKESIIELQNEGKIKEIKKEHYYDYKFEYSSLLNPNYNFSYEELEVINDVIERLGDKNARYISDYSHGDMPWRATEDYGIIDYGFVFYRDPKYSVRIYDDHC